MPEGFLLIDKPVDWTSHDVVAKLRRLTGVKRIGHAGTLDPFATGLLIVGVGRTATRELDQFLKLDKTYEAVFALGARSDTDDRTGVVIQGGGGREEGGGADARKIILEETTVREAVRSFLGEIEQVPPAYSAVKIGGKKMYEAARAGKPLEAKPRRVRIDQFEILDRFPSFLPSPSSPLLFLPVRISCSSGTYIRALARDLGERLGVGGYVEELRRTRIGPFSVSEAHPLDTSLADHWESVLLPPEACLDRIRAFRRPDEAAQETQKPPV